MDIYQKVIHFDSGNTLINNDIKKLYNITSKNDKDMVLKFIFARDERNLNRKKWTKLIFQ